jgi:hypothetical protein
MASNPSKGESLLSSWQVAQIHGAQSQQFGASQAYSQQLSSMMPPPYQGVGIGATGGFGGGMGYNFGSGWGGSYAPGNAFGNRMTSMVGGFGSALGSAAPIAGAIGGGLMGGLGGAMFGWGAGGLAGAGISHVANSFMEGAHEQSAMERTLSQFQHFNGASRTGRGFSRTDATQIGNMVREMERIPEMLTSFGELNRLMDKMGQMGLMQGVRDAGEFMKKFKDTVGALKDLSKAMGSTMEGALQAFGEARMSGFYSNSDITRNVLNRQFTSSITGMNQGQIGALQVMGGNVGHATGGSRRSGAQHALRTANQLGMANQMGIISNEQILEMTGKEGAEGIQDLAADMTQLGYRMGNTNVGQALTLALGEMKDGRYTGRMDEQLVSKVRNGGLGLNELMSMARGKASTRTAKLSFAAHKERLRSEMVGAVGSEGIGMELQDILGERGWQNPDAVNLVMQRFGASEEQANLLQKLMPNMQDVGTEMRLQSGQQSRQHARDAIMRERYSWDAIKAKIGKKISHHTTDWAKDLGVTVRDSFQNFADDFIDELAGSYTATLSKNSSNLVRDAMMGSSKARSTLSGMIGQVRSSGAMRGSHLGIEHGGFMNLARRMMGSMAGGQLSGERLKDVLSFMQPGELINSGTFDLNSGSAGQQQEFGNTILEEGHFGGYTAMTQGALGRAQRLGTLGFSQNLTGAARSSMGGQSYDKAIAALQTAASTGSVLGEGDTLLASRRMTDAVRRAIGDDAYNKLKQRGGNSDAGALSILASDARMKGYDAVGGLEGRLKSLTQGFDTTDRASIARRLTDVRRTASSRFVGTESGASFADIDKAMSEDSTMRNIILGTAGTAGLVDTAELKNEQNIQGIPARKLSTGGFERWKSGKDDAARAALDLSAPGKTGAALRRALAKDASEWTNEESAAASSVGMTKEYAMKNKEVLGRIRNAIDRQGGDVKAALKELGKGQNAQDILEIGSQLKGYGERISNVVDRYREQIGSLSGSGRSAADKIQALGKALEGGGIDAVGMIANGGMSSRVGEITELIEKASPKDREKLINMVRQGGLGEIDSAVSEWDRVMKVGKRRGFRGQLKDFVKEGAFGSDDEGQRMWKELETGLSKDGTAGVNSPKEAEWLAKQLSTGKAAELMTKTGTSQQSKYMSEQEVANSLKTLSENNLKATQIISNLAAGKTGKDAMEGVGK